MAAAKLNSTPVATCDSYCTCNHSYVIILQSVSLNINRGNYIIALNPTIPDVHIPYRTADVMLKQYSRSKCTVCRRNSDTLRSLTTPDAIIKALRVGVMYWSHRHPHLWRPRWLMPPLLQQSLVMLVEEGWSVVVVVMAWPAWRSELVISGGELFMDPDHKLKRPFREHYSLPPLATVKNTSSRTQDN